jgi:type I restriction enzyme, S subunit
MIADLKPYPAMKDSGVEWLGGVPEHWEVLPNRALFDEIKDRDRPDEQMLSVTIKRGVIKQARLLEDTSKKDSSNLNRSNYKFIQPGDIAYNKMRAWQGAIGASDHRGIISPAYVVQRPREGGEPSYFHHLFRIPQFAKEAERWSYGITSDMWSLRPEHFKLIYTCLPPLPEQAAIVRYLDHVDRRVRRLTRAKRKLIALLTEQKQAIIHRAVTRGLDPDVPLKDSGVEWLGEVPEHWEVVPLKFLCRGIQNGTTPSTSEKHYYHDGTVPWFGPSSISASTELGEAVRYLAKPAFDDGKARLIGGPALLVVVIGATVGKMGLLLQEGATNQQITAFELKPNRVDPQFAIQQLHSCEAWLKSTASTATIPILDSGVVSRIPLALPGIAEQERIISALAGETRSLDTAIDGSKSEIELLGEYRTRLIADVVTGKLDVREAAAGLSEVDPLAEADDTDDLDADLALDVDELDEALEEAEA